MPADGENLREHLAAKCGTSLDGSQKARARLTEIGAALGFAIDDADNMRTRNGFHAHQLVDRANQRGRGHATERALFSAGFTHRRNVSDIEALAEVAAELGLDKVEVSRVLNLGESVDAVREKPVEPTAASGACSP